MKVITTPIATPDAQCHKSLSPWQENPNSRQRPQSSHPESVMENISLFLNSCFEQDL